ncbi:uncharacterized protein GLRG_11813 [Colletotrichum graminicola M1.001]|uniref:Uncharacterized protein n=1 Tax=Colletotrichum graminicola (strain M1.001 / M2 / FGSC 10212) TaxID=645133 RepID=E3R0M9_COLGM|nr:uncharacterized protein GLRG_11813 [Colletotrichum graminicola M1.001]EFQ36667.1 hypothetical protein GLRG_11813 [Colletotrichum graminicola M1.001]
MCYYMRFICLTKDTFTIMLCGQPDDACKMRYGILPTPMIESGKAGNGDIRYGISHPIARVVYGMHLDKNKGYTTNLIDCLMKNMDVVKS